MVLEKLQKIDDLRQIWKHEAQDFSKWLSEEKNLEELSNAVGVNIVLGELESSVGSFSVDLYATEEGSNRKIIIENQLEDTDHDHLGKIITYAAGKSADVIIWIVKRARDEHRQAVEWLNQHTDENVGFFLIEIELWTIGNSLPAPKFNVVEKPNDWAKAIKTEMSDTKKLQYEFWQNFTDYAFQKPEFSAQFSRQKVQAKPWHYLSVENSEYHLATTMNIQKKRLGVEIYIYDNKELYSRFLAKKSEIEQFLGMKLDWIETNKACRIFTRLDGDIRENRDRWKGYFDWFCDVTIKLKAMLKKFDV